MLLPEDICNRSPGFGALVIQEETPSPLPVGCPTDGLAELNRQHFVLIAPRYGVGFLITAGGGTAPSGSPFCLCVPHQARMLAPLPEVHAPSDPCSDLSGPADAQSDREDNVAEDKGYLRVPAP